MITQIQMVLSEPFLELLQRYWAPMLLVIVAAIYMFGRHYLGDWFDGSTGSD